MEEEREFNKLITAKPFYTEVEDIDDNADFDNLIRNSCVNNLLKICVSYLVIPLDCSFLVKIYLI